MRCWAVAVALLAHGIWSFQVHHRPTTAVGRGPWRALKSEVDGSDVDARAPSAGPPDRRRTFDGGNSNNENRRPPARGSYNSGGGSSAPQRRAPVIQLSNPMILVEKGRGARRGGGGDRRGPPPPRGAGGGGGYQGGRDGGGGGYQGGGGGGGGSYQGGPSRGPPRSSVGGPGRGGPASADVALPPRDGAGPGLRPGKPPEKAFGRNLDRLPARKAYERPKRDERTMQFRGARGTLKRKKNRKGADGKKIKAFEPPVVLPNEAISVQNLATKLGKSGTEIVKLLMMKLGVLASLTQNVDGATARAVAEAFDKKWVATEAEAEQGYDEDEDEDEDDEDEDDEESTFFSVDGTAMERGAAFISAEEDASALVPRAPVVTIMGHVDHGKTSLLDAIRSTRVTAGESGGITQAIGAYGVTTASGKRITFIDTPGHSAFSEMRQRGANVTDIVVLVVAADDGVKEQTVDSIACAKAARVPVVVAVNKVDLEGADPSRVETDLTAYDLVPEAMGGETIFARVSAKARTGLDELLDALLLQAEVMELKANPAADASGSVVESGTKTGLGVVATVLIQRGTLKVGDIFVAGAAWGRCRAIQDDKGGRLDSASPSDAVQVVGWQSGVDHIPVAGDSFAVVPDENTARRLAGARQNIANEEKSVRIRKATLGSLDALFGGGPEAREYTVLIKADTAGSVEAIRSSLERLDVKDDVSRVRANIVYAGVGDLTKSDMAIASVSNAYIIAFNVAANSGALEDEKKLNQRIRYFDVIYDALDDVQARMFKILSPTPDGDLVGTAEVKQLFDIGKLGRVAGCGVLTGYIKRSANVRVMRGDEIRYQGTLKTLRNVKTDVARVDEGQDCGLSFRDWEEVDVGDVVECYDENA